MARLYLVRHGQAAAGWDADTDPGLSDLGRRQADAAANALGPLGPLPVFVSPLRRCRETAEPFARAWAVEPVVDRRVGEVATPGLSLAERGAWLRALMASRWEEADEAVRVWRDEVVVALHEIAREGDAVVVTHFVAINVAIGEATGDGRTVVAHVDNCSITTLEAADGRLELVEAGRQATTEVL